MSRANLFLVMMILITTAVYSQSQKPFSAGSWELSLSGSFGSLSYTTDYTSTYSSYSNSESNKYFEVYCSPAVYAADGFSIEPEVSVFLLQRSEPSYSILLNASYTYRLENKNIALFIRGGYGLTNSFQFPINGGFLSRISNKFDVPILNVGAGVKFLLSNNFLLRTEINYRKLKFSVDNSGYGYSSKSESKYDFVSVLFGVAVIL